MSQREQADLIISSSATTSAVASGALSQVIGSDRTLVLPVAEKMVVDLGRLFGKVIEPQEASAVALRLVGSKSVASIAFGLLPGIGNIIAGSISSVAIRSLGWAVFNALSEGREISSLTEAEWRQYVYRK